MAEGHATGYRSALRLPVVRRLWAATATSTVGDYIGLSALLFLAADRSGRVLGVAAVLAVGVVPALLAGTLAGPWIDRLPRARSLASLQFLGAPIVLLPLLADGLGIVLVTAALLGGQRTAASAARTGAIADGVPDAQRGPLVALLASTDQGAQVAGFLTGGALYLLLGVEFALAVDALTFLAAGAIYLTLRIAERTERPPRPPVMAGVRDIVSDPVLRLLAALVLVTGTVASLPETLAPFVAGPGDPWRPVVLASAPLGQAVTMTLIGRLDQVRRPSFQLVHFVALALALGIAALARSAPAIAAANLLVGAGVAWIVGPQLTFLRLAPRVRMAQISGTMIAGLAVADGVGSLAYAGVAELAGVSGAYRLAGATLLAAAVIGWLVKERIPDTHLLDRGELPSRSPSA